MHLFRAPLAAAAVLIFFAGGCKNGTAPCTSLGAASGVLSHAAVLRLDIYSGAVHCVGQEVMRGAPTPTISKIVAAGQPIKLDIPAGPHALLLSAFADSGQTQLLGTACTEANFQAGDSVCFNLALTASDGGRADQAPADAASDLAFDDLAVADLSAWEGSVLAADLACPGGLCACTKQPDSCPVGQYCAADGNCAVGCRSPADCTGGAIDGGSGATLCDVASHRCVQCLVPGDCALGKRCSPSGACVDGCDIPAGSLCPGSLSCCSNLCLDTTTNVSSCGACGRACASTQVATPSCAAGLCQPVCLSGFGDCNRPIAPAADDGCETNLHTTANCGACNAPCNLPNATPACPSGTCQVASCATGFFNCDGNPGNGCECAGVDLLDGMLGCCAGAKCQSSHVDGFAHSFFDCETTYTQQLAKDAARAFNLAGASTPFPGTYGTTQVICSQSATECVCWAWADSAPTNPATGYAKLNIATGTGNCRVPTNADQHWN